MTTETQHQIIERLSRRRFASIPDPQADLKSLYNTVLALKESLELLIGERADPYIAVTKAVTWADLLKLGLVEEGQLPRTNSRT